MSAAGWTSDCNVLQGTTGPWGQVSAGYPAEWFAASGQDRHSIYVAPAFAAPDKFDLHVDSAIQWGGGIPGMYVGMRLDPPVSLDRDGKPVRERGGAVSIGAYDYPDPRPTGNWRPIGKLAFSEYSTFLDICTPHPQKPEYVYSRMGIKRVDPKAGAVELLKYSPARGDYCCRSVVLGGRPFVGFASEGSLMTLWDVSDP